MRLWVDDIRTAPEGWAWAKTYDEAIALLASGEVVDASLDHDLGYAHIKPSSEYRGSAPSPDAERGYDLDAPTGYDIIKWMVKKDVWPSESLAYHTRNPVGAANMARAIENDGPYHIKETYQAKCGTDFGYVRGDIYMKESIHERS